jgi:SPP1 gp7 family putative phage head morphogenesis protein
MDSYWHQRQTLADAAMEKDERALSIRVHNAYESELRRLNREIAEYYQRYGENGVLEYRRLMETMDPKDRELLIRDCDEFLRQHPDMQSIVDVRKSIYQLNRLEGLQASARLHLYQATGDVVQRVDNHIMRQSLRGANTAAEAMGFGRSFYSMDSDAVRRFVDTVWTGNTSYSQRIWDNTETLASYVAQDMSKALARGDSYQRIAKALEKRFVDVPQSSLMRLVYTEGTYVSRMAQVEELKREGFDSYTMQAVHDGKACEQCHGVEGKTFRFEDMQVGVNFPPLHPYCRCQIAPAVDDWDAWQQKQEELARQKAIEDARDNWGGVGAKKGDKRKIGKLSDNPLNPKPGDGNVVYVKDKEKLEPHEVRTVDDLVRLGYKVVVSKEDSSAASNIDLELGANKQKWEMKNISGSKSSINKRMREAYHKWIKLDLKADDETRVVITSYGSEIDEETIIKEIANRMKDYAAEVIYIYRSGEKAIFLKS